nr:hypothetical protein [Hydrogenophaga sp.]
MIRLTASSDRLTSATTTQRSRRGKRSPGHSAQTIISSQAPVMAWRRPSCNTADSHHSLRSAKPADVPIACITGRSRPEASQSSVKASRPNSQTVERERCMAPM